MTLEGKKISTSQNWAIWAKDIVHRYDPDSLRFFFIGNGPERRDSDFSWREYVNNHNGELLGAYGNLVNRTLVFVNKYFDSVIPHGEIGEETKDRINGLFETVGEKIDRGALRDALEEIFEFVRYGNKYFDEAQPWKTRESDIEKCKGTMVHCVGMIANLSVLLHPFLPFSSEKVRAWLGLSEVWEPQVVSPGAVIPAVEVLFERLDKKLVDEEIASLKDM